MQLDAIQLIKETAMECKVESNKDLCACASETCENRGICCDCLRSHLAKKSLPVCMRKLDWLKKVEEA